MLNKMIICFVTWILYLVANCGGRLVTYQRNYDLADKRNWENQRVQKECNGLVINNFLGSTTFQKVEAEQIVFDTYAQILFEADTEMIFDADSGQNSLFNCISTNSTEMSIHGWHNPSNWLLNVRLNGNEAVPHMERLPCEYDDVVFPKGLLTGGIKVYAPITVKSLKYGQDYWTNNDIIEAKYDEILGLFLIFMNDVEFNIRNRACNDPSGCLCGNEDANPRTCVHFKAPEKLDCSSPITPVGFCHAICGASITFPPKENFKINSVDKKLQDYTSDTHVSKIKDKNGKPTMQIVFTEKQFTGNSLDEAKHLYKILENENVLVVNEAQLFTSSSYYNKEKTVQNVFVVIFGTLLAVCLVFGSIILLFGEYQTSARLRDRLGISSAPLTYRSIFFSRSSVSEGAGLIGEGQSMAGSLQNISRPLETHSFSHMKKAFSTSSSNASSTEELSKDNQDGNGTMHVAEEETVDQDLLNHQLINTVAEEGDLVDLTPLN